VTALKLLKEHGERWTREHAVIERQVQHMTRLVGDLLDVSRITRGKIDLKTEPVALDLVITKAIEMTTPLYQERRHLLLVDVPSGLVVVGDQLRLSQVFANLLTNAATYTPAGGRVQVNASSEGAEVRVDVTDTGQGISPELLPRVFDLFVQGRRTIERREGGLGLGLSIARSLLSMHGGRIEVSSPGVGLGATFTVHLAAARLLRAPIVTPAPVLVEQPLHTRGGRVLVVDDNRDAAEMLELLLSESGYSVRIAADGPRALDLIREFRPDIAMLDIGLPIMDGYELARRIRERLSPNPPVLIAVTGYGQQDDQDRSRDAGFAHHLVKPVDLDALLQLLTTVAA
jgi:CheY-like chemotaxis protein